MAAIAEMAEAEPLADPRGRTLLRLARAAIRAALDGGLPAPTAAPPDDWLAAPGATFVTLFQRDELRGCIGSVRATLPLGEDVRANAVAAALRDPRFPPLRRVEAERVRIEVSLLSPLEPLAAAPTVEAAAALLRAGVDGLVLELCEARGVFLPQVWSGAPDPVVFLRHLRRKAGLARRLGPRDAALPLHRREVARAFHTLGAIIRRRVFRNHSGAVRSRGSLWGRRGHSGRRARFCSSRRWRRQRRRRPPAGWWGG